MNTSNTLFTLITISEGSEIEKQNLYDDYKQLFFNKEWWLNTIAYITVVCGIGNILTFMQRGFLKNVLLRFYFVILALVDMGR